MNKLLGAVAGQLPAPLRGQAGQNRPGQEQQLPTAYAMPVAVQSPLLPDDPRHREEWMAKAKESECARSLERVLKEHGKDNKAIQLFKEETFSKVYEALGAEVGGEDLARALVVRNEKFGKKTACFLTLITLGVFCCVRPRDDDTVLVLTKQGRVVQLKVERPSCCPPGFSAQCLVCLKYVAIVTSVIVFPIILQSLVMGKSERQTVQDIGDALTKFPDYARENPRTCMLGLAVLAFWISTLLPHDYRDRYRRRHMAREVAAGQLVLWGWSCRRRSSMRLFFGKYPHQGVMDLQGTLGNSGCVGPVNPNSLLDSGSGKPSAPALIVGLTLFISIIGGINTVITWYDRSIVLENLAKAQLFCQEERTPASCNEATCEKWGADHHVSISAHFCDEIFWELENDLNCVRFGRKAPCCSGCNKGGWSEYTSEGTVATIKSFISLIADGGTMLFTFIAAKYALGLMGESDHIDVLIKRRSRSAYQIETAKFDNTVPVMLNFMEYTFAKARSSVADHAAVPEVEMPREASPSWCGVQDFYVDNDTRDWDQFFAKELLVPPDARWTSKVQVLRRCLGIAEDETVLAAWAELPLYPVNMSLMDFLTGGLIYQLLPFGTTRHTVVVTNRRLFYVRYRRPILPFAWLGHDLRVDCFRHDNDVFYGQMSRARPLLIHKLIHQVCMRENFLPGQAGLRNKFGAIVIHRSHGDVLDVFKVLCRLSRDTSQFIDRRMLADAGMKWAACQETIQFGLTKLGEHHFAINPEPDDTVEPKADFLLSHQSEELIFHTSFKNLGSVLSSTYSNTDVVVTSGRVLLWNRAVHKKWDCQACCYYWCCWNGLMNKILGGKNLPNTVSFFTLPSLLSFSTDMSIDPPSWLSPHHHPLKCACLETLFSNFTNFCMEDPHARELERQGHNRFSCWPKRTGPSASVKLMWRLKQSAQADEDFIIVHTLKPYVVDEVPESDIEDVYAGIGFKLNELKTHAPNDEIVEALRKIMGVAQDQCHKLLDKVDSLY